MRTIVLVTAAVFAGAWAFAQAPKPKAATYNVIAYDDDGVAFSGALTVNEVGRSDVSGSFDGEGNSGSWYRTEQGHVVVTIGNEIPDNSITFTGLLVEGVDGPVLRGHYFRSLFTGPASGACQATLLHPENCLEQHKTFHINSLWATRIRGRDELLGECCGLGRGT